MLLRTLVLLAALVGAGCSSPPPAAPTGPPDATTLAARKDLEAAHGQKGYAETVVLLVPAATPALLADGRLLFAQNCAFCHGIEGRGDGKAARELMVPPRNFHNTVEFKWGHDELALFRTAKYGAPGSAMLGWEGRLSDAQLWAVVHYVHQFVGH